MQAESGGCLRHKCLASPHKDGEGRCYCNRKKWTPSLAGRPLFAKSSTGAFCKFTPGRAPDDEDFARCGGRQGALPLDPTSFLKKARPKTFLLARLRFQWKQAGYYFPIALRRSPKGEGALRYTAPERGQEIPDHSTPMSASAQCGHAPRQRSLGGTCRVRARTASAVIGRHLPCAGTHRVCSARARTICNVDTTLQPGGRSVHSPGGRHVP